LLAVVCGRRFVLRCRKLDGVGLVVAGFVKRAFFYTEREVKKEDVKEA